MEEVLARVETHLESQPSVQLEFALWKLQILNYNNARYMIFRGEAVILSTVSCLQAAVDSTKIPLCGSLTHTFCGSASSVPIVLLSDCALFVFLGSKPYTHKMIAFPNGA